MPTSVQHATGAPRTIKALGEEWRITPITERDWGEYLAWLRDLYVEFVNQHAAKLEDAAARDALRADAIKKAATVGLNDKELLNRANSPAGIYRLVRMHLLPAHPDISEEKVAEILNDDVIRAKALQMVEDLLGENRAPKKKTRSKRTGTKTQRRPKSRR